MDDDESDNESAPPPANGHAVPAAAAANGAAAAAANGAAQPQPPAPQHPLWERAAGRGGGGGGGGGGGPKGNPGQVTSQGRFGPISMAALEQRARHEFDGASSVGARTAHERSKADKPRRARGETDDEDNGDEPRRRKKRREGVHDYDDLENADDEDDNRSEAASGADVCAGAAFGGGGARRNTCRSLSVASDTDDGVSSVTSSRAREAHRRAFPISGETCVGCALPAKVGPVDEFVRTHCDKMREEALFKMAALIYQQQVVEPAESEDVPVPVRHAIQTIHAHTRGKKTDTCVCAFACQSCGHGRTSGLITQCTAWTPRCSATRTCARWPRCARPSSCRCKRKNRMRKETGSTHWTRPTRSKS